MERHLNLYFKKLNIVFGQDIRVQVDIPKRMTFLGLLVIRYIPLDLSNIDIKVRLGREKPIFL